MPDTGEEEALGAQVLALNRDLNNLTRNLQKANAELEELNQLLSIDGSRLETPLFSLREGQGQEDRGESSTGLGLMISRRIVESHGERISVESKVGEGSVFRVSLPVRDEG